MLGENHKTILRWLLEKWDSERRSICVIEGFSGVGKTEVASEYESKVAIDARIDAPESGSLNDLLFSLASHLAARGHLELANAIADGRPLDLAFESMLSKPLRIIVDEFQRMFNPGTNVPSPGVDTFIERISKRASPARILLLSHHNLDKTMRWGERVVTKQLRGLKPEEGAQLLAELLHERDRDDDIPEDRRIEISRWLGGNPRAMRVLVGCLEEQPLDDLTGIIPERWEARDQEISQVLSSRLERELLTRALMNLDGASATSLERVAVYRADMDKDAITRTLSSGQSFDDFLSALTARFLIDVRHARYALIPIVREISLQRLKTNSRLAKSAHKAAAGHYTRHFTSKQIVNPGALGGDFVEARYHLVQAEEFDELGSIAQRFGSHLQQMYGWVTPEAHNETQRNEIIAVLSAFLEHGGPKAMEYYLARLLNSRNGPDDDIRALKHVRRSTSELSPVDAWVLRIRLEAKVEGTVAMMRAAKDGFFAIRADAGVGALYHATAEHLANVGQRQNALDTLEKGIAKVPPEGATALYLLRAEILANGNEIEEAILLLREGLLRVPVECNLSQVYLRVYRLLCLEKKWSEAIAVLEDGIDRIPSYNGLSKIFKALADLHLVQGRVDDSIRVLEKGLDKVATDDGREDLQTALIRILANESLRSASSTPPTNIPEPEPIPPVTDLSPVTAMPNIPRVHILVFGTEWESRHGGLSTFNRDLCIELAAAGHYVVCVIPDAQSQERESAAAAKVELITPIGEFGFTASEKLLQEISLPTGFSPKFVIGHDRKTGPHARYFAKQFPAVKFVLFVHTQPTDIEWHKDKLSGDDAAVTSEAREQLQTQLACDAHLVIGVGPKLTDHAKSITFLTQPRPIVHQMDPGFRPLVRPDEVPPGNRCLLLGRAEDKLLKGLDIASRALGMLARSGRIPITPRLVVRGAVPDTAQQLREEMVLWAGGKLEVEVRNYSPNMDLLQQDIKRSSLVIMPSRSEGFGLVALEAIAAKVPILVSDTSGIASLLRSRLGPEANAMIVDTVEDLENAGTQWKQNIERVLLDTNGAFAKANDLHNHLEKTLTWRNAITELEKSWRPLL